jgi:hypothetical protein
MKRGYVLVCITAVVGASLAWPVVSRAQLPIPRSVMRCLHDESSSPADRARREQARPLVRAVNSAQGRAVQATRGYVALGQLSNLPEVPVGFELRVYTDSQGYVVSLKDSRDPCHFGIFSDQDGRLYEMTPQVPLIAS